MIPRAPEFDGSSHGREEIEVEVREMLYGRRSRAVRLRQG
jgi:hypothetical protein